MNPPSKACRNCGGTEFYAGESTGVEPITFFFLPPKFHLRICGTCGLMDWFLPEKDVKKLKKELATTESDRDRLEAEHGQQEARQQAARARDTKLREVLAGKLAVRDLPEAWNSGMEQRFGARPTGTADGCLQDMHWALGHFGYFPSYALGLVIAAQLWEALRNQLPEVDTMIERGEFAPVFSWLRDNMHGFGAKLPIKELIKQASGQGLSANALLRYLQGKYLAESA